MCKVSINPIRNPSNKSRPLPVTELFAHAPKSESVIAQSTWSLVYRLNDRGIGVRVLAREEIFLQHPDRFWDPPSLLFNGYRGLFPWGVEVTTHLNPAARSRMVELYLHSPICSDAHRLFCFRHSKREETHISLESY
jgi:hypothetical protein